MPREMQDGPRLCAWNERKANIHLLWQGDEEGIHETCGNTWCQHRWTQRNVTWMMGFYCVLSCCCWFGLLEYWTEKILTNGQKGHFAIYQLTEGAAWNDGSQTVQRTIDQERSADVWRHIQIYSRKCTCVLHLWQFCTDNGQSNAEVCWRK